MSWSWGTLCNAVIVVCGVVWCGGVKLSESVPGWWVWAAVSQSVATCNSPGAAILVCTQPHSYCSITAPTETLNRIPGSTESFYLPNLSLNQSAKWRPDYILPSLSPGVNQGTSVFCWLCSFVPVNSQFHLHNLFIFQKNNTLFPLVLKKPMVD